MLLSFIDIVKKIRYNKAFLISFWDTLVLVLSGTIFPNVFSEFVESTVKQENVSVTEELHISRTYISIMK